MNKVMKTMIVFLFFAWTLISNISAQKPYVSMKECGNDTIKYIETNLRDNKERYIGKPFAVFTSEFEMDIRFQRNFDGRQPIKNQIWGVMLGYIEDDYYYIKYQWPFYDILIEFERPYLKTGPDFSWEGSHVLGKLQHSVVDYIVKDIEIRDGLEWWKTQEGSLWKGGELMIWTK